MEFSKRERLILYNQYEILKFLKPEEEKIYNNYQTILADGYKRDYSYLVEGFDDELSDEIAEFVWDVFQMYRTLLVSYRQLSPEQRNDIKEEAIQFEGYDGNEEGQYHWYACFILEDLKRYTEISEYCKNINSHARRIKHYTEMIQKWIKLRKDKYCDLSFDQIKEIISVG